jgi:restriction endonuclease Mrr
LAVPSTEQSSTNDDLIAIWRTIKGNRFQNYRAIFSILNVSTIPRKWIEDPTKLENAPDSWKHWIDTGKWDVLKAEQNIQVRTKEQQSCTEQEAQLVDEIYNFFMPHDPVGFEKIAAEIYRLTDQTKISIEDITRASRDGGRDAIGKYQVGIAGDPVYVTFYLEAKCYHPTKNSVGVKEVSRLTSRLRYREFGVVVTTSYFGDQVQKEIKQDKNPVVLICGKDIARILIVNGKNTPELVKKFCSK